MLRHAQVSTVQYVIRVFIMRYVCLQECLQSESTLAHVLAVTLYTSTCACIHSQSIFAQVLAETVNVCTCAELTKIRESSTRTKNTFWVALITFLPTLMCHILLAHVLACLHTRTNVKFVLQFCAESVLSLPSTHSHYAFKCLAHVHACT